MQNNLETIDQYVIESELGTGANAIVYRCYDISNPTNKLALKIINYNSKNLDEQNRKCILNEAKIMQTLDHTNIVKFIELKSDGIKTKDGKVYKERILYTVSQLAKKGTILPYLTEGGAFPESIARYYFHQLVSGLSYLHKMGYVHRDLKPDNLLIGSNYEILIADFGHSISHKGPKGDGWLIPDDIGTTCYNPQEIYQGSYKGIPADTFMVGVLLFIFLTGVRPFNYANKSDFYYRHMIDSDIAGFWNAHKNKQNIKLSLEARNLIASLLSFNPNARPSLEEVLNHKWMSGLLASEKQVKCIMRKRQAQIIQS